MNNVLLYLYVRLQNLMHRQEGQDLVEYALLVALVALGATAGMKTVAGGINGAFNSVSVSLKTDI
jgi:pilus assembly protein Flp/PilA